MQKKTYYEILGVSTSADLGEIRSAYLGLARKYHPDRHPGNREYAGIFAGISEAYRVLSNLDSKYAYDLELGLEPGKESTIPVEQRIELAPVTGTAAGDYMEEIAGGMRMPELKRLRRQEYAVLGLESPVFRRAFEMGVFSIERLEGSHMHRFYMMGVELLKHKDYERACAYLEEAVELNSANLQYRFALGCCYEAKKDLGRALEQYRQALRLGERQGLKCRPVREAIILICMRTGRPDDAEKECVRMSELGIDSSCARTVLKQIHKSGKGSRG